MPSSPCRTNRSAMWNGQPVKRFPPAKRYEHLAGLNAAEPRRKTCGALRIRDKRQFGPFDRSVINGLRVRIQSSRLADRPNRTDSIQRRKTKCLRITSFNLRHIRPSNSNALRKLRDRHPSRLQQLIQMQHNHGTPPCICCIYHTRKQSFKLRLHRLFEFSHRNRRYRKDPKTKQPILAPINQSHIWASSRLDCAETNSSQSPTGGKQPGPLN